MRAHGGYSASSQRQQQEQATAAAAAGRSSREAAAAAVAAAAGGKAAGDGSSAHLLKHFWPFCRLKHLQRAGLVELARVVGGRVALPLPDQVSACDMPRKANTFAQQSEVVPVQRAQRNAR